jgi:hypothetical protein
LEKSRTEWKEAAERRLKELAQIRNLAREEVNEKIKAYTNNKMPSVEDYKNPTKDYTLPPLNTSDLQLLKKESKPVVLKKKVIDNEKANHPEIELENYNNMLAKGLYGAQP